MELTTQKKVIALGFFDGVHLGHGALLKRTVELAETMHAIPAAHTFSTSPSTLVEHSPTPLLTTPDDRAYLMQSLYGIKEVMVAPFDEHMMTMPWDRFVTHYLMGELDACGVVAGHDYRFGYKGEGTPEKLRTLCAQVGLVCEVVEEVKVDGHTVSSTYIRSLVEAGEMEEARRYLGHPHLIRGQVRHGKGLGKHLGFPTVNISPGSGILLPAYGVYASMVTLEDGKRCPAATNIGVRPTIEDGERVSVEAFLLDFDGDVYGQTVGLELYRRLRAERVFDSLEALRAEVAKNAEQTRAFFESMGMSDGG